MKEAGALPPECPFWARSVTLGHVFGDKIEFCHDIASKLELLERTLCSDGDVCFVAWTGRWTTSLYELGEADAHRLLSERMK